MTHIETMKLALEAPKSAPIGEVCGYYERGFDAEKTRYGKLYNQDLPLGIKLYTHSEISEADELLMNLGLNPVQYRTEGGAINHLKVKAAILHPEDYPQYVKGALVIPGYESGPMVEDNISFWDIYALEQKL